MKFFDVWHDIAKQNKVHKFVSSLLTFFTFCLIILIFKVSANPPLLIERGCETKAVKPSNSKHTTIEVKEFLYKAMSSRFNSSSIEYLSFIARTEAEKKAAELSGLIDKGVSQDLILRNISISEGKAKIAADRLLSYKKVRAATAIELDISFEKVKRTPENPYGLLLTSVKIVEEKNEKN